MDEQMMREKFEAASVAGTDRQRQALALHAQRLRAFTSSRPKGHRMTSALSQAAREKLRQEYDEEQAGLPNSRTPSRTYVNASIREPYTGNNMQSARDGANDFQQVQSAHFGAQIRRNP